MISHFQFSTFNFQLFFTISDFVNQNCEIKLKQGGKMQFWKHWLSTDAADEHRWKTGMFNRDLQDKQSQEFKNSKVREELEIQKYR